MEHFKEKIKKTAMKEGENYRKKISCEVFFERKLKKKENNYMRSQRGKNKEREDNKVLLGNFGSETGRL